MNNTTTYLIIGIIGVLVGMVFAVLLTRLKNPNKHDDVFNLTPEQRAERDGDLIGSGTDFITTEQFEKQRGEYPVTPADAFPPLVECAKTMSPPASADSYPDLKDPEYVDKMEERSKLRTEQLQKEMEEKRMAQVEKDKLRDAEIEEERVLKYEAARIKTELKKWMY